MLATRDTLGWMRRGRHVHFTHALCPECDQALPAELVELDGDVQMRVDCPAHGASAKLYYRDARLYRALLAARNEVSCCDEFSCARGEPCRERSGRTMIFVVNVTNNCNMSCQACFSGSDARLREAYVPSEQLLAALPPTHDLPFTPHAVFLGGEPTLHPELPRMVEEVARRGYLPRLASNGLKLEDERYARALADAGLRWVFLHFDSTDDALNHKLRGRKMLEACKRAIASCRRAGMKVQFGVTLSSENIGELVQLLETAHSLGVFWVSLYPLAEIERMGPGRATYLADAIAALSHQSRGQIRQADFVAAARIWSRLFRATGRLNYRQKPTMVSLPVVFDRGRMVPLTRMLSPLGLARYPGAAARMARAMPSLADYENREPTGDTLVVNIQQFQGRSAFDLEEATHSLMSFVHQGSYVPFDIFNHVQREGRDRLVPPGALASGRSSSALPVIPSSVR
jgi:uncharacterized radical SAM superfamily Fe-S cluster-containing enzyme